MQKWQYVVQDVAVEEEGMVVPHPLNVLGDNGWELVAVVPEGSRYRLFLKRPVYPRLDPEVEKLITGQ